MIIINTDDVSLIMNKDNTQDIKKMLLKLKDTNNSKFL